MADPEVYDLRDGKGLLQTFTPNPDPAKGTKQDTANELLAGAVTALETLAGGPGASGGSTETTLAAILAKIIAAPATQANQATIIGHVDGIEGALSTLNAKDFATQTTLAALLAKVISAPATEAKQDTHIAATALIGTRAYGTPQRIASGAATALSTAIAATEVLLHATGRQFVLAVSGSGSPTITAATAIPMEDGEKFHMRITSGQRIATIRDTADGFLHIVPVA